MGVGFLVRLQGDFWLLDVHYSVLSLSSLCLINFIFESGTVFTVFTSLKWLPEQMFLFVHLK